MIRNEEASIHFQPTLSACFSESLDQGAVPKSIWPTLETEGVADRETPAPASSPAPPSRKNKRTSGPFEITPETISSPIQLIMKIIRFARRGVFR